MPPPTAGQTFTREACGCPVQRYYYPYKCPAHAGLDGRVTLPWRTTSHGPWYDHNSCPFCGKTNPYGLACDRSKLCDLCGVRSCHSHGQATYLLKIQCPREINPRTKQSRQLFASLTTFCRALGPEG